MWKRLNPQKAQQAPTDKTLKENGSQIEDFTGTKNLMTNPKERGDSTESPTGTMKRKKMPKVNPGEDLRDITITYGNSKF